MEPAGLCGRCTAVAVPLRVLPSPTGLTSKRGPYSPWGHKELDMAEQLSTAQPKNLLRAQRMESLIVKQNEGEFSLTIKYFLVDG